MSDISSSIWQQNGKGDWRLYFNIDSEFVPSSLPNTDKSKIITHNISEHNIFLGTLVMTPSGIGRLIKNDNDLCTIQYTKERNELIFPINKISNYFNCLLFEYNKGNTDIIRLRLKVIGKVEDIFNELEKIKKINREENDYNLVYNGIQLKNDFTFEQLNICNNCKMMLLIKRNILYSISRFSIINKYWFTYSTDGICFSPSKRIILKGIGIFGSYENKKIFGVLKILDGASINCRILYEENIEIPPSETKADAVIKIYLTKPVICKKEQDYSVILFSRNLTNSYCGQGGKSIIEGDNGISFSFKRIQGRSCGTGVESGNFPELYYYEH